jgi:hypothetical protein
MVPAGRVPEWGDPVGDQPAYPDRYGRGRRAGRPADRSEPGPAPLRARRPRRRFRLPFKRLIVAVVLVLLLLSAAGRISNALRHETHTLWANAWKSAQHTVEQQVTHRVRDGFDKITGHSGG